jgi:cytochrome c oxidase subunit III
MMRPSAECPPRGRPTLDVSHLPALAWDSRSPLWWGNLLGIISETVTVALLVAGYFYVARNITPFPPPRVTLNQALYHTAPRLGWGTLNTALLLLSCVPMYFTDRAARRQSAGAGRLGLLIMLVIGVVSCWVRWREFDAVHFTWDANAYASFVWGMLVLHLFYLLVGAGEMGLILVWTSLKGVDEKHGIDITLMGGFWYWLIGCQAVIYSVIYWSPRLLAQP